MTFDPVDRGTRIHQRADCGLQVLAHSDTARSWLDAQRFWAYPPPMVEEGAGSLELYGRYKYGSEERKYFRNHARRMAAKSMVRAWLLAREVAWREKG